MYFDLNDDQKMMRDQLQGLLREKLSDAELMSRYNEDDPFDAGLWSDLVGMGLAGILAPANKGGLGMDLLTLAVVVEELGRAAAPVPLAANAVAAWLLAQSGRHQAEAAALISGDEIAAFALAGPNGWRPEDWTLAGRNVTGEIRAVEWGAKATLFVIGLAGGKLGLVRAHAAGVSAVAVDTVDRTRPVARLVMENAAVDPLSVDPGTVGKLVDALAVVYASDACGAANRALDMALAYAGVRKQFDKLIGQFQGLKFQLVDMAVDVKPCRALSWYAAHAWDAVPADASRAASLAKAHITDVAVRTGRLCVECHGGIGYTWEYPLHVWLKRAMHDRAMLGPPADHRSRAAALAGW